VLPRHPPKRRHRRRPAASHQPSMRVYGPAPEASGERHSARTGIDALMRRTPVEFVGKRIFGLDEAHLGACGTGSGFLFWVAWITCSIRFAGQHVCRVHGEGRLHRQRPRYVGTQTRRGPPRHVLLDAGPVPARGGTPKGGGYSVRRIRPEVCGWKMTGPTPYWSDGAGPVSASWPQ